jgi:5-formyl-3-hydroxy-2-methylpyridine 4-carboxylate dehydrogenase
MQIAIIGMGSMGPGMAARLARGGHDVRAQDIAPTAIERSQTIQPIISEALDGLGVADQGGVIVYHEAIEAAVSGADLVIENVPEKIEIKAEVYAGLDRLIGAQTLVASDTSGIPITQLQAHISHPERFIGMHWSNHHISSR